ncbi:MAG: OmpA family protein [Deltaproteobacteria bacterium]|nr:OmpA family protein [Deltaproteobacteria bacterium]
MFRTSTKAHCARDGAVGALLFAMMLISCPVPATASDFGVLLQPGVAVPLTAPQSERFETGGGQSLKMLFGLNRYLDIGPSASFLYLPSTTAGAEAGVVWGFGGSARLKRPHDAESAYGISPWLDADALFIRTGPLNRFGFAAAAGLAVPIGEARAFWFGPLVRYLHTTQGERAGFDNRDAKLLIVGVSLEVGPGRKTPPEVRVVTKEVVREVVREVPTSTVKCADRDSDGVPDIVDRCPDVAGTQDQYGCPEYKKVVVKRDKLELKEKIQFAWNEAKLEDASLPLLDEVAQALKDNKGFRVQIEGHTSSEGAEDHNQALSERRATAVLDYLEAHGVAKSRLVSKGFSSSVPVDTNATTAGRESNRRVEFVVYFILLNDGSAQ